MVIMNPKDLAKHTSRLGFRASLLYLGIPLLAAGIFLLLGGITYRSVTDEFSRRLARQHSIEAAANFQKSMHEHFVLMQQISRSRTISRWLANEYDEQSKSYAFYEMMGFTTFAPQVRMMFTVYESLRGFYFDVGLTLEEFLPWGQLAGGATSQWFFDTRDSQAPFIFNIQRLRPVDDYSYVLYVWSNHRLYYEGNFVGTVTAGTPFERVFNDVFGGYNVNHIRGYIIDENGAVRADSARALAVTEAGLPIFPAIPERAYNPELDNAIEDFLQIRAGLYHVSASMHDATAIPLSSGIYRYASISPIQGTDWSILVLSNQAEIQDRRFIALYIVIAVILVAGSLVGGTFVNYYALNPLSKLTQSVAHAAKPDTYEYFYGLDRNDEIGVLARTIQEMRDQVQIALSSAQRQSIKLNEANSKNEIQLAKMDMVVEAAKVGLWELNHKETFKDIDTMSEEYALSLADCKNIIIYSDSTRHILGYCDENDFPNILGVWLSRIHPDEKTHTLSALVNHFNNKGEKTLYNLPCRILKKNGEYGHFLLSLATVRDENGKPEFSAGMLIDDSERNELIVSLEEQRQLVESAYSAKSLFLRNVSHELRTPLNAIMGISEICLQSQIPLLGIVKEAFSKINASGRVLLDLVNDLLDASRMEIDKLELKVADYEIASMLVDVVQFNVTRIGSRPIDFKLDIDENMPSYLLGDELHIKQILNNILSKAFNYSEKGTVKLKVYTEPGSGENDVTLVLVVNNATVERQMAKIFADYANKADNQNISVIKNIGLGMNIAQHLIDLMNGKIFIKSDPESGLEFTIHLPQGKSGCGVLGKELTKNLCEAHNTMKKTQAQSNAASIEPMPYGRVLIVDDVEINIYVIQGLLEPFEIKTDSATSGFEAIEKIKEGNVYDIIFMDHMMPKMDGMEATKTIRSMGYNRPIVAFTANATIEQAEIYLTNGFDDFISKPVDMQKMLEVLNKLVRRDEPH